jgi:hypothetical protein
VKVKGGVIGVVADSLIDKVVIPEWGLLRIKHISTSAIRRTQETLCSHIVQFFLTLKVISRGTD